jgi:hypothetical protein
MFRIDPGLPVQAYKTFQIRAPRATHFRKATCAEVACPHYVEGWRTRVESLTPDLLHAAKNSGRKYTEQRIAEGETWLLFEPGQACFAASEHRVRLDKPELYVVRDGDWRGNPTGRQRQHSRPADWVDDFGEHQLAVKQQHERG